MNNPAKAVPACPSVSPVPARRSGPFLRRCLAMALAASAVTGTTYGAIVEHVVAPKSTDPAISVALDDHYAMASTDRPPNEDLFVFMPGTSGKPVEYRQILLEAARQGFRTIGLMYANSSALYALCPIANTDVDCWAKVRTEIVSGQDASALVTVSRADSIENRLIALLTWLHSTYPDEGWGKWIVSGGPDWSRMRLAGWSQGGGHAAYIAKDRDVAGVICFSSPQDFDLRLGKPAAWLLEPHVTPASRYFGFIHEKDATALWSQVQVIWPALGMGAFGPPVSVDTATPPYGGSHQLVTSVPLPANVTSYHKMTVVDAATPRESDGAPTYLPVWRSFAFWESAPAPSTWMLPSSARTSGAGSVPYTTDVTVSNTGSAAAAFTLKFLGHGTDGRQGPEKGFSLPAGESVTYPDVLGSLFGVSSDFGAIRLSSASSALALVSQTWTPSPSGGSVGQSVPAFSDAEVIRGGAARSILPVREDAAFRTNLILANVADVPVEVEVALVPGRGARLGSKRYDLPPLGMVQVTGVVRDLGVSADVAGARLVLSTSTPGGAFAAYAAVIDNATNDPRTLLPR